MTLLAIDTSEQSCSVALLRDGRVLARTSELIGRGHAERLLPLIEEKLAEANLTYGDLARLAVTTGPGTFTGLRIGLSVARGLALHGDLPCIGLTGLDVLAARAMDDAVQDQAIHAVITGRGGQAFLQSFCGRDDAGLPAAIGEAKGRDSDKIVQMVADMGGVIVGSGVDLLEQQPELINILDEAGVQKHAARAIDPVTLGRLARHLSPVGHPPEPTYFRDADAKKAVPVLPIAHTGSR